jgi:hypothetical protein
MGVLSNVLNMLNAKASADSSNVHTDTQHVNKRRHEEDNKEEKAERRAFRVAVGGGSLHTLAVTMAITSKEGVSSEGGR